MSQGRLPHLFEPLNVRGKTLRNRMVMPAMATHFAQADGSIGPEIADYLGARAAGGFAMVITENLGVHPSGKSTGRMAMVDDDSSVAALAGIAAAIQGHSAIAIGQINHCGRQTSSRATGGPLVAPSPIPCPLMREMPKALDLAGIADMQDAFVSAALRIERAGFDGVEIHAAHGYLAASFLSPYSNHRTDAYGGDAAGRQRFLREIVRRVRAETAPGFLISVRLSVEEFVPNGLTADDAIQLGALLSEDGIDILSLSVGVYESYQQLTMLSGEPEGPWLPIAGRVRAALSIPIIGVGRIRRPEAAEAALASGQIDLAAFARTALTNPAFPIEAREADGPIESACIGCNLCLGRSAAPEMVCPVNPFLGREAELKAIRRSTSVADDLVIHGGGFAALTAAWLEALKGRRVTVVEPEGRYGGMQDMRSHVPGQAEVGSGAATVLGRARDAGVGFSHTPPASAAEHWGVRRYEPARWDIDLSPTAVSSFDALRHPERLADAGSILVVGDDLSAADAALVLADRGARVVLRSPSKDISFDSHPGFRRIGRAMIEARGGAVETNGPMDALFDGAFDAIVVGRTPGIGREDGGAWQMDDDRHAAVLEDAYEPGALTGTVYAAVDIVRSGRNPLEQSSQLL